MLEVVVIDVGDSLGNFAARNSAVEVEDLLTNLLNDFRRVFAGHKLVVKLVAAAVDLNVVKEVRVYGGKANTAVVHLASENFVTEEVVSEDTAVGVGEVERLSQGNVGKITEHSVHRVVLLLNIVEMAGMLINAIITEHVLEKKEAVVISILDGRSIVENTNVTVNHLIISNEEEGGNVDRSFLALDLSTVSLLGKAVESLGDLANEFVVVDVSSTNNNKVVTEVMS